MTERWHRDIVELHEFFEGWLGGTTGRSDEAFDRLERALAPGFTMVGPDGGLIEREPLLAHLRAAHGARPGLRIWIERPRQSWRADEALLATYEEWQLEDGRQTARLSTVLMLADASAPNGWTWRHVHETWRRDPA